jgi:putative two-component system response regulator
VALDETGCKILIVDDDVGTSRLLAQVLGDEGYKTSVAHDGLDALLLVEQDPPDLIFLDLELPRASGYDVCRIIKSNPTTQFIPIIMLTGHTALEDRLRAWDLDVDDFLTKPFQMAALIARCRALLRAKRLRDELDSAENVAFAFARAVEAKSPYTHGHSERVQQYSLFLAKGLNCSVDECESLRKGALLHDIGKISIPDQILDKQGPLTAAEYEIVKMHPTTGAHILEPLHSLRDVIPLIRWHHERCDGTGYPDGKVRSEIPNIVRILSVADVYDSLASMRPYRPAMSTDECRRVLWLEADQGNLDSRLVEAFCDLMPLSPWANGRTPVTRPVETANLRKLPLSGQMAAIT